MPEPRMGRARAAKKCEAQYHVGRGGGELNLRIIGMLASLLGCSFEAFVINDESIGSIIRAIRGIEVTEETLAIDTIADVVEGADHFLGTAQTISVMETEYLYPVVGDRPCAV